MEYLFTKPLDKILCHLPQFRYRIFTAFGSTFFLNIFLFFYRKQIMTEVVSTEFSSVKRQVIRETFSYNLSKFSCCGK